MTQQDKTQMDKTKDQLVEGMRKSKAAGSSPSSPADAGSQNPIGTSQRSPKQGATENAYSLGGLRWPD